MSIVMPYSQEARRSSPTGTKFSTFYLATNKEVLQYSRLDIRGTTGQSCNLDFDIIQEGSD